MKTKSSKKHKNYLPVVYKKYKIDSVRFHNSNIYYTSKIEDYNEILEVVKDSIQTRVDIFEEAMKAKDLVKKEEKEKRKRLRKQNDSIKKAQRKKGYIPALRYEIKNDSIYFFDNNEFFPSKVEVYEFLVKEK